MPRTYEEDKVAVKEAVKTILSALNGGNQKQIAEVIYDTVSRDHRTLQQCFWSSILQAQILYSKNDSDMRNEQAVELAKGVHELAKSKKFDYGLAYF